MGKQIDFSGTAKDGMFLYIFPAIIISFILISLWADVINKFYYGVIGFNRCRPGDALFLACFFTFFLFAFICFIPHNINDDKN